MKADNIPTWRAAVKDVENCGFIGRVEEIAPCVHVAMTGEHGWGAVASLLADHLPGQLLPLPHGGIGWKCGGHALAGNIIATDDLDAVLAGRWCVRQLTDASWDSIPWTLGGLARKLLTWAADPGAMKYKPSAYAEELLFNDEHKRRCGKLARRPFGRSADDDADRLNQRDVQYHDCTPGVYSQAYMWDVDSYYWRLLGRLRSLRVQITPRGLQWLDFTPDERARWKDVLEATREERVLRNSLWGKSLGTYKPMLSYSRGGEVGKPTQTNIPGHPGPFRSAALLVARSGSELCQLQSLAVGSVYSTVDSVTVLDGSRPRLWESLGFECERKGDGTEAEICHLGSWRVSGNKATKPYIKGERDPGPVPPGVPPARLWYKEWLT